MNCPKIILKNFLKIIPKTLLLKKRKEAREKKVNKKCKMKVAWEN